MSKLDISIARVGTYVAMQIHSMDERFRAGDSDIIRFYAGNGMRVVSSGQPELDPDTIYLFGSCKLKDNYLQTIDFDSFEEAEDYLTKVLAALKEWSTEWQGWNDDKEIVPSKDNRYQF